MRKDNWRFEALARAKIVRQEEEEKKMKRPEDIFNVETLEDVEKRWNGEKGKTMKHTKGPWKVGGDGHEHKRADGTPWRQLSIYTGDIETGKDLEIVCSAEIPKGKGWFDEESRANAHLIAASPELLEVCKDAYKLIALTRPDTCGYVLVRLSDAIAKAEGGTK